MLGVRKTGVGLVGAQLIHALPLSQNNLKILIYRFIKLDYLTDTVIKSTYM